MLTSKLSVCIIFIIYYVFIIIAGKVVIAGGWSSGASLRSTEVLDVQTRTIQYAGELTTGRIFFHLITISTGGSEKTLALGGFDGRYHFDSVEELDAETMTWKTAPTKLAEKKSFFGAVALPRNLVCQA